MSWDVHKIGDVLEVARGGSPRPIKKYLTDDPNGLNWIKISDATASNKYIYKTQQKIIAEGLHKTRYVEEGDFLLSNSMSFGRPYIMKTDGCIHDGWLVLKKTNKVDLDNDFLYHLLGSQLIFNQFDTLAAGSTVRNLNISLVSSVEIPIPPLPEQKRIVEILDEAFEAIDQAKANIERNIQNAEELFQSKLNEIFSQKGEGWEEKRLGEMSKIMYGYTSKVDAKGNIQYLRITDIQNGNVDWDEVPYVKASEDDRSKYKLIPGDIVFARTGATTGKSYLLQNTQNALFASYLIRVQCDSSVLESTFLYLFFHSGIYWKIVNEGISGSAQGGFNATKLGDMIIHFPTDKNQQLKYVELIDTIKTPIDQLISEYNISLSNLEELKKSILQKAFSGELIATEKLVV